MCSFFNHKEHKDFTRFTKSDTFENITSYMLRPLLNLSRKDASRRGVQPHGLFL